MTDTLTDAPATVWADRFIRRELLPAGELARRFNISNPRSHPEAQREATESSLDTIGWIDEISLSTNGNGPSTLADNPDAVMFDGHERVELALVRGGEGALVPVNWYQLTPEETDFALLVKDQTTEMAETKPKELAALLERTRTMTVDPRLGAMLAALKERAGINGNGSAPKDVEPQLDKAAELQKVWGVQLGDVWSLGEHRLACGDCTDRATVEAVMRGERARLVVTDPPYGVSYADKNKFLNAISPANRIETPIENDHATKEQTQAMWKAAFSEMSVVMDAGAVVYCFMPQGGDQMMMMMMMMGAGIEPRHELIWLKNNHVLGRVDYAYKHEPILYAWKDGGHKFYGDFQTSILEYPKPQISDLHPTQKPLALIERLISNSSKPDEVIYDPFTGSGTVIIAGENLGRKVRAIEIDPSYCSVTLQRYVDAGGQTPRRVSG